MGDDEEQRTTVPTFDIAKDDQPSDQEDDESQHLNIGREVAQEPTGGLQEQDDTGATSGSYGPVGIRPRKSGQNGNNRPY